MRGHVESTAPARGRRRARRLRWRVRHPGRLPRAAARRLDRRRRHQDRDRARRSGGSTRSASTSSRCAPTTSSAAAPSRSPSSTTSPSASVDPVAVAELVGGVAAGCRDAGCALVGGETAEHPGLMEADAFDLAGCCIGVVERARRHRRLGGPGRRRDRRAGVVRAPRERLLARPRAASPSGTSTSREPYQARLRRTLGDAAADAAAGRGAARGDGDARRGPADADADLRPGGAGGASRGRRGGHDIHGLAHITGGGLPGNVPRALPRRPRAPGSTRRAGAMPSVMRLFGALGGLDDDGAAGDVQRRPRDGRGRAGRRRSRRRSTPLAEHGIDGDGRRRGRRRRRRLGRRALRRGAARGRRVSDRRIAVGVSGAGSNLRALRRGRGARRARRRDRRSSSPTGPCPALDWAAEQGIETALVPGGDDATLAATPGRGRAPTSSSLPATCGSSGRRCSPRSPGRILNTHPSLLPAFPGAHAVRDALAHGVRGHRLHGPPRRRDARRRPDRRPGGGRGPAGRRRGRRCTTGSGRRAPAAAARGRAAPGRRRRVGSDGRRVPVDLDRADAAVPVPRRALLSVSDKTGLADARGAASCARGFELVSTGGTARALREAGLPVTDVGRGDRLPRDARRPGQDAPSADPRRPAGRSAAGRPPAAAPRGRAIAPFELVVVNLYPFAAAARAAGHHPRRADRGDRHRRAVDGPGGGQEPRQRRDRDRRRRATTRSSRRSTRPAASTTRCARALALEAFGHTAAYDARIAAELPARMAAAGLALPDEPGLPGASDPYPARLTVAAREGRDAALRREPAPAGRALSAPGDDRRRRRRSRPSEPPLQGKALSYNNVLDAAAAAALGRALRGPACVIVKHTNPCGAAERPTLLEAWEAALAGRPGQRVRRRRGAHAPGRSRPSPSALVSIFLEVVVAPGLRRGRARRSSRPSRTCGCSSTRPSPRTSPRPADAAARPGRSEPPAGPSW